MAGELLEGMINMNEIQLFDKITLDDEAAVRVTDDGYLVAMPRVARVGIQDYLGREVGKPEMGIVRVLRPADEVFSKDAMHSFAFRPITNDHPPEHVKASNWKKYAVGHSGGEIARDGDFMRVPLVMMDAQSIADVRAGKHELSAGYRCMLDWTPGEYNGEKYDAVQRSIRGNHIAIVGQARGGDKLKIGDQLKEALQTGEVGQATRDTVKEVIQQALNGDDAAKSALREILKTGDTDMNDKTMTIIDVDGVKVSMDETSAAIVNRHMRGLNDKLEAMQAGNTKALADAAKKVEELEEENEKLKKEKETSDAKIAALESQVKDAQVTPAKLDQLVKDRALVVGKARAMVGDKLTVDGKTDGEIRRQVVDAKLGDTAKNWSDDKVEAAFDTLTAAVKSEDSGVERMRDAFSTPHNGQDKDNYSFYDSNISNAWKQEAPKQ